MGTLILLRYRPIPALQYITVCISSPILAATLRSHSEPICFSTHLSASMILILLWHSTYQQPFIHWNFWSSKFFVTLQMRYIYGLAEVPASMGQLARHQFIIRPCHSLHGPLPIYEAHFQSYEKFSRPKVSHGWCKNGSWYALCRIRIKIRKSI